MDRRFSPPRLKHTDSAALNPLLPDHAGTFLALGPF